MGDVVKSTRSTPNKNYNNKVVFILNLKFTRMIRKMKADFQKKIFTCIDEVQLE